MPEHFHALWIGIDDRMCQLKASKFFRKQLNTVFEKIGYRLQHQAHDRVLRDDERMETAFESLVEYIARNPERAGLVPQDGFRGYKYTGCLVPGNPELTLWQEDFWQRFSRTMSFIRAHELFRPKNEDFNVG